MLSPRKVIRAIETCLGDYRPVPGRTIGAKALFYKSVDELVLSIGIEFSTRYVGRFTASFYLGRSFSWAYVPLWFPRRAYARVGHFLEPEERAKLLDSSWTQPGVLDAWWWSEPEQIDLFCEAVEIAAPRFCNQPGLIDELNNNPGLDEYILTLDAVSDRARSVVSSRTPMSPKPPIEWHQAADAVLSDKALGVKPKAKLRDLVATDSWRREILGIRELYRAN